MRQRVVVGTKACALSRSGTIELADVIHHHALGVETRDQRLHRVLADAYPFWRIAGVIKDVIERQDLIFEDIEELLGFRSDEHTSELQSLMRISYAGFGLQKTKHNRYQ